MKVKYILISISVLLLLIGLTFVLGYLGVFHTKTVGKAQQNAQREVFETSQSYVEGKRQEATKLYKEYLQADNIDEKNAIAEIVGLSFANVDESLFDKTLSTFIYNCKYKYNSE